MPGAWQRHPRAPWYQKPAPADYGLPLDDGLWLIATKQRSEEHGGRHWHVFWTLHRMSAAHGNIVTVLFETRTLKAARLLSELWASGQHQHT